MVIEQPNITLNILDVILLDKGLCHQRHAIGKIWAFRIHGIMREPLLQGP